MGRKNRNVRNRNVKRDHQPPRTRAIDMPRIQVESIVMPDGQCHQNSRKPKARFATEKKARAALAQAQHERARRGSTHVEKRFYFCDFCQGYHLTSRETYEKAWS